MYDRDEEAIEQERPNPLAAFSDEELIAEFRRRGMTLAVFSDEELIAECGRRGMVVEDDIFY